MPTPTAHAVAAITAAYVFPRHSLPKRAWVAGALCALAPDLDTLPFHLGVRYGGALGHRGISHSLVFAALLTLGCAGAAALFGRARGHRTALAAYLAISLVSHDLLDMLTTGGHGVALLAPFSNQRLIAPFHPIAISPLSPLRFVSMRGVHVVVSEFVWIGLPCLALVAATWWVRGRERHTSGSR
jgi:inner membrane protein